MEGSDGGWGCQWGPSVENDTALARFGIFTFNTDTVVNNQLPTQLNRRIGRQRTLDEYDLYMKGSKKPNELLHTDKLLAALIIYR